jgi:hypothetical protein
VHWFLSFFEKSLLSIWLKQHTIDRIDSVILKRVQQSQQALAEMDAETRYQEEVCVQIHSKKVVE